MRGLEDLGGEPCEVWGEVEPHCAKTYEELLRDNPPKIDHTAFHPVSGLPNPHYIRGIRYTGIFQGLLINDKGWTKAVITTKKGRLTTEVLRDVVIPSQVIA